MTAIRGPDALALAPYTRPMDLATSVLGANAMEDSQQHWERIHREIPPEQASWFQDRPAMSLDLITAIDPPPDAPVVDVGGGTSMLVDLLLDRGQRDVAVVDVSASALDVSRRRLGARSDRVEWIVADVTQRWRTRPVALWHDRAVFHFLVEPGERESYLDTLRACVVRGGHVILATFSLDGPSQCSGLPVRRYDVAALAHELGPGFETLKSCDEVHRTPRGREHHFVWAVLRRVSPPADGEATDGHATTDRSESSNPTASPLSDSRRLSARRSPRSRPPSRSRWMP